MRMIPVAWFALSLLFMFLAHRLLPLAEIFPAPLNFAGLVPAFAGALLAAIAANEFRKLKTSVNPLGESTALVTSGPFRFTRNPMYLGMVLALCGIAMVFGSLSPWLPVPAFAWLIQVLFVVPEEKILAEQYGEAYRAYRRRVGRWF